MLIDKKNIYVILDLIMSEYGWGLDYCLKIPHTIILELYKVIIERHKSELKLQAKIFALGTSAGFNGKMELVENLFKEDQVEEVDEGQWKAETKAMWVKFGKDPDEFERKWAAGEQIVI